MNVLLTGAFGSVGLSTLEALIKKGHRIRAFELRTKKNLVIAKKYTPRVEIMWGDLRNPADLQKAVQGQDLVLHLAGIIPPLADQNPKMAETINVGGTYNMIKAMESQPKKAKFIFTSSIAVYGDRRLNPYIQAGELPNPNAYDEYARQKLKAENLIQKSKLEWSIFRLTYIVSTDQLQMDPLMFKMPLDTCLEVCDRKDVGLALANAVETEEIWGKILPIGGGEKCRIIYKDYLDRMTEIFGLGKNFLTHSAFSKDNFYCAYLPTEESQELLNYQRHTLEDYFKEVKKKVGFKRYFMMLLRPLIRHYLLKKSSYYQGTNNY